MSSARHDPSASSTPTLFLGVPKAGQDPPGEMDPSQEAPGCGHPDPHPQGLGAHFFGLEFTF